MASDPYPPPITTTIPSNPAASTPNSSASPPRPSPNASLLRHFRAYLLRKMALLAHKSDRSLVRLSKLLASPSSTDALLCTTSYTLSLLHALLSHLLTHRLTALATSIADKADQVLLPGETFIATIPAPPSTHLLAQTVASTKALAAVVADYRVFVRLWGLAGIYMWARETWNDPLKGEVGSKDKVLRAVTWGQVVSCAAFQVLENGAYLASKGALTSTSWSGDAGKAREARWWIWSSRFWAAHVLFELIRLAVLHHYYMPLSSSASPPTSAIVYAESEIQEKLDEGEKEGKLLREERKRESWLWWRDLVSNVAYMPMTLHWSVEDERGLLSDWGVGFLGAVAGGALLVDAWKRTA